MATQSCRSPTDLEPALNDRFRGNKRTVTPLALGALTQFFFKFETI